MRTLIVHSENSAKHRYTICQNKRSGSYFLTVDGKLYKENKRLFEGTFDDLLDKLKDLKAAETLKTF